MKLRFREYSDGRYPVDFTSGWAAFFLGVMTDAEHGYWLPPTTTPKP